MGTSQESEDARVWPFWRSLVVLIVVVIAYYFIATPGPDSIYGYLGLLAVIASTLPTIVRGDRFRGHK